MSFVFPNGNRTVSFGGSPGAFGGQPSGNGQSQPTAKQQWRAAQPQSQPPPAQSDPASRGLDMSSYRPGQAQPVQQSQGTPYQPFSNQYGEAFNGTMSFAPGTPNSYREQAYTEWARRSGYSPQSPGQGVPAFGQNTPGRRAAEQQESIARSNSDIDAIMRQYPGFGVQGRPDYGPGSAQFLTDVKISASRLTRSKRNM
jgi:hypothetical protein